MRLGELAFGIGITLAFFASEIVDVVRLLGGF